MKSKHAVILFLFFTHQVVGQTNDLVKYVNTLQGTNSKHELTRGNTYPTTALPFGMHTWTPQTGKNGTGGNTSTLKKQSVAFSRHISAARGQPIIVFFLLCLLLESLW
jgi:putative alpha-1,2-mannosidase